MIIEKAPLWQDYQLLDSGNGKRLERFGALTLVRPDPQAIWKPHLPPHIWNSADATFEKEGWKQRKDLPSQWKITYNDLQTWAKLTPFKHTGIFPEQAAQWEWMREKIEKRIEKRNTINVLNMFAYTGMASLACAASGAHVTHLDASRPAIAWAKENQLASNLQDKPIRWILDDALKFTEREIKRGKTYDAIIMDPPIYGHGPEGEVWDFHKHFPQLLANCRNILSTTPLFVVVNAYAISSSALMLQNVLDDFFSDLSGTIEVGELVLQEQNNGRLLSTGIFGRWSI